jgi:hypothetical protein
LIVYEAWDESKKEQITFINRFVNKNRFIWEGFFFFDIVHVKDTTALILKEDISSILSHYNLNI